MVITESTYSDVGHDPREQVEEQFAESVKTTLWEGYIRNLLVGGAVVQSRRGQ
jgi:Cft2 family RNA processing exonuclease